MYNLAEMICNNTHDKDAIIWMLTNGESKRYTYGDLDRKSNQVANMLIELGVRKGDRVLVCLEKNPETIFMILGIIKSGAIYCPLFASSGIESINLKIEDCKPSIIVIQTDLIKKFDKCMKSEYIKKTIIVGQKDGFKEESDNLLYYELIKNCFSTDFKAYNTKKEDISSIHYTSGTTSSKPKGAIHLHGSMERYLYTMDSVFEIKTDDVFWCTADFAWITGTIYGIFGPLGSGATIVITENQIYSLEWVIKVLIELKVNIWYTAPTLLRMLNKNKKVPKDYKLSCLKSIFSVGELLDKAIIDWGELIFQKTIRDTWFQTETGSIVIANYGNNIRKGSMGRPLYDTEISIVNSVGEKLPNFELGKLCIKKGLSSLFNGYWNNEELYNGKFIGDWYKTGDIAYVDDEGFYWFYAREDDVINTAGHLVNPLEVESIINEIEYVDESIVFGIKDLILGEAVKAKIVLKEGIEFNKDIEREIKLIVRRELSPFAVPQRIDLVDKILRTDSGKIVRAKATQLKGDSFEKI